MNEVLHCVDCGTKWTRLVRRGTKPKRCQECHRDAQRVSARRRQRRERAWMKVDPPAKSPLTADEKAKRMAEWRAEWQRNNPDNRREAKRLYRQRTTPEQLRADRRRYGLRKYGLTPEQFTTMLEAQGSRCAICGASEPGGTSQHFHIDHDHGCCAGVGSCGRCIRGLLCVACNQGLGHFGDDPTRLIAAARYLAGIRVDGGALVDRPSGLVA